MWGRRLAGLQGRVVCLEVGGRVRGLKISQCQEASRKSTAPGLEPASGLWDCARNYI